MGHRRAIVTGFGPFGEVRANPSAAVLAALAAQGLGEGIAGEFVLFETAYGHVSERLPQLLVSAPDLLLLTGYSGRATGLALEMQATSRWSATTPDNAGERAAAHAAPVRVLRNEVVDCAALAAELAAQGIAAAPSGDAGEYVCNHTYFTALDEIARRALPTRALFVHLPAIAGLPAGPHGAARRPLAELARGLQLIARRLAA